MTRPPSTDAAVSRIASRQLGIVTRRQLDDAGVSEARLRYRLAVGTLVRAGRAVYRVTSVPRTWEQRALAACLAAGPGAVLSRRSAATVWHLDLGVPEVVDVATADRHGRSPATDGVRVHRVRALAVADVARVGVLPVTTVARTLVDLVADLEPAVLRRVVDDALVRDLVTPARMREAMTRLGGRGRPGFCALRAALEVWNTGSELESVAEAAAVRLLAASGLPAPVRQHRIVDADGREMRLDFAWPDQRVTFEVDGFRWHAGPRARDRDSSRTNTLIATGWTVVRATPAELDDRAATVVDALRRHLAP
jgi:very-short-patch-repair endonuclease